MATILTKALCDENDAAEITLRNRLYFDGIRTRFFDERFCYDFSFMTNRQLAERWCAVNGFEFIDNRLGHVPEEIRLNVLRARRAGQWAAPRRNPRHFRLSDYRDGQHVDARVRLLNEAVASLAEGAI